MANKDILKKRAIMFLEADIKNDGKNISISFDSTDKILPAFSEMTDILDDIDEENMDEYLGFSEEDDKEYE